MTAPLDKYAALSSGVSEIEVQAQPRHRRVGRDDDSGSSDSVDQDTAGLVAELRNVLTDWNGTQIADNSLPRVEIYCGLIRRAADALAAITAKAEAWKRETMLSDAACSDLRQALTAKDSDLAEARAALERAEQLAYDLKYAAAGGEDVPGSAHAVTVADVDRWRREAWDVAAADRCRAAEMASALEVCQRALAMMIAPDAIKQTTVINAFAAATEAEARARTVLSREKEA